MLRKLLFMVLLTAAAAMFAQDAVAQQYGLAYDGDLDTIYTVRPINQEEFRERIADWTARDWVMVSERPVVVGF